MNDASSHPLLSALLNVAGRRAPDVAPSEAWHAYARFLFAARRRILESPPCPTPVLRRVHGLYRERREGPVASILRLVFDSWREAAPATRGPGHARDLRYEGEGVALDLRVVPASDGSSLVQVAAEPARAGLSVVVETASDATATGLDDTGFGELSIPPDTGGLVFVVRDADREVFRTPPLSRGE